MVFYGLLGLIGLGLGVAWWRHPHHHHRSGMRIEDSPFNSRAAVYEAYDTKPDVHPYGDYDGD
jgi:hypothetical protein